MNRHFTSTTDETPGQPEPAGDREETDTRQLAPEADDQDVEEAGYGYGV